MAKITTLFEDSAKTEALYPRTKVSAVSDGDNTSLEELLDDLAIPSGGTVGQVLTKQSSADRDADWETPSGVIMDLLWTNSSPTSSFGAQTISLELSEYKMFAIKSQAGIYFFPVGGESLMMFTTSNISYRNLTSTVNGITFTDAQQCTAYNQVLAANNARCVPLAIYGIR